MNTTLKITRADPAGNLTLFIEGNVPADRYAALAADLLNRPEFAAEQAGYADLSARRLEMSGGDFCGNASRAFGFYIARQQGLPSGEVQIQISGCSHPVRTLVDPGTNTAFADMPLPAAIGEIRLPDPAGIRPLVRFEGIWHILMIGCVDTDSFPVIRDAIYRNNSPEALGVMYISEDLKSMVPMVYVAGPGTLYRESSCGSGTAAVAAWLAMQHPQPAEEETASFSICLKQPGGELGAEVLLKNGTLNRIRIGGPVSLEPPVFIDLEI